MKAHGLLQRLASMIGMNVKIEDFFDEYYLFNSEKQTTNKTSK